MKTYKDFYQESIGASDIASVILVGPKNDQMGLNLFELHFGGDGCYSAYIVRGEAEIGKHYKQVAEFNSWVNYPPLKHPSGF